MSWWVAGRDNGNGQAYVFQAPTLATAKQEAQGANSLLTANGGPYATRAAAQAAADADNGKAGGGSPAPPSSGSGTGKFWVTWKDESDGNAARKSAIIWGPQADPPPQQAGWFLAGSFATKADAQAYVNAIGKGTLIPPKGTPILGGQHIPNPLSGIDAVGAFFSNLTQANTWIRVAEVLIGIALIGIGVARITGAENAVSSAVKNIKVIPV